MKKIGITCDNYKTNFFRKRLLKLGYVLEFDGESGVPGIHLFRIDVKAEEFGKKSYEIKKVLEVLEIDFKRSN